MPTRGDDLLSLLDFAFGRLSARMAGLDDAEWAWQPTADDRISVRWRLSHLVEGLGAPRNAGWLGLPDETSPVVVADSPSASAASALADLETVFTWFRRLVETVGDAGLAEPVGEVGGRFAADSRFAFVLHVADELVHHGAEAALLRDLYERR